MSGWRQMAGGLAITLVVIVIIGAGLTTAIAEQRLLIQPIPPTNTPLAPTAGPSSTSGSGEASETLQADETESPTGTIPPLPSSCPPPPDWLPYEVRDGDTLAGIAAAIGASPVDLAAANCLTVTILVPGSILYLPELPHTPTPSPTSTATALAAVSNTPFPCGPPTGWVLYTVRSGDTLFSLAQAMNTTVSALQFANCMGGSTYIQAGARLWVPFIPTATATQTPNPTPSGTASPSPTASTTPAPTFSPTATAAPTQTPSPTASPSPTPTDTGHPPTATPTGTATPIPSSLE